MSLLTNFLLAATICFLSLGVSNSMNKLEENSCDFPNGNTEHRCAINEYFVIDNNGWQCYGKDRCDIDIELAVSGKLEFGVRVHKKDTIMMRNVMDIAKIYGSQPQRQSMQQIQPENEINPEINKDGFPQKLKKYSKFAILPAINWGSCFMQRMFNDKNAFDLVVDGSECAIETVQNSVWMFAVGGAKIAMDKIKPKTKSFTYTTKVSSNEDYYEFQFSQYRTTILN
eukprot:UN01232